MSRPMHPLPEGLGAAFTAQRAAELSVPKSRLRGEDLERPFRGVYRVHESDAEAPDGERGEQHGTRARRFSPHPADEWRQRQLRRAKAFAVYLPAGYFFCGYTAAVIWGLPTPAGGAEEIEVACFSPARALRVRGVRGTRIDPRLAVTTVRDGMPVTDAATTWCMLAPRLARRDGIALGDGVIRRPRIPGTQLLERAPHATLEEVERAVSAPFRRGRSSLLEMLPLLSPHSASAPETHLRLALAEWGVPEPTLDFDVYAPGGRLLGCSEIAFPEYRVVYEYEGDHHRTETSQWNRDIEKHSEYRRAKWEVIRVTAALLYRRQHALRNETFEVLVSRGWRPHTAIDG